MDEKNDIPEVETEKVEEAPKILRQLQTQKNLAVSSTFHRPTSAKGTDKRGVGTTRKDKSSTKKADKLAKKQRKINHKRAIKKSRPTGSKKRK